MALERLAETARRDGAIGPEVGAGDIATASIRFRRPLALGLDPAEEREIAHRYLDTYLNGLSCPRVRQVQAARSEG